MATQRPTARYRQVANELRDAINAGAYAPGEALPSQPSLARQYGLNQTSISRAMAILEAEGLVRTEHGRGSYVAAVSTIKRVRRIPSRGGGSGSSFVESLGKSGLSARTELVQAEIVDPPAVIAGYLDLAPGQSALIRKRHMFADDHPVQLATSYIPQDVAGGVELAFPDTGPTGIYRRLANRGHRVVRFAEQVDTRRPSEEEAEFLGLSSGQSVLQVVRFVHGHAGRVLEVVINVFPGQLWSLSYEWEADNPAESRKDLPRHSVSVTGVVIGSEERVLAIKRADDERWVPPGGVLELGETPEQGVIREVMEETGVEVRPDRLIGVYKNMDLGVVSMVFLCRPVGGRERTSTESDVVVWLSRPEAEELMPEARAVRVADAFRGDGPFVRVHDGNVVITPDDSST
ncbi:MAG TPA: UTRA domain-containing protein [Pseudonocardia sp.]|jgi:GntR family transcriptional regulator|uniref:UTRA domain-containing protein n=1 Tax=Pseudonocardia sp. TaxID=60912 RepID=UPI002F4074DF